MQHPKMPGLVCLPSGRFVNLNTLIEAFERDADLSRRQFVLKLATATGWENLCYEGDDAEALKGLLRNSAMIDFGPHPTLATPDKTILLPQ